MHTLARCPVRERSRNPLQQREPQRAFTLIELLTVIAIIAILAAITFGVVRGVNERAAISQAKAELAVMTQALEAYKKQYGDYPQAGINVASPLTSSSLAVTHTQYYLFNALAGKLGPKLDAYAGKRFVDLARFSLETENLPATTGTARVSNSFLDPWGRRYVYYYKASGAAAWTQNSSYILLSAGPDGATGITSVNATTGVMTVGTASAEADNIYANSRPPTP